MAKYNHTAHYYETDIIGFTHHSNYVRWMEKRLGWSYQKFEDEDVISPLNLSHRFIHPPH